MTDSKGSGNKCRCVYPYIIVGDLKAHLGHLAYATTCMHVCAYARAHILFGYGEASNLEFKPFRVCLTVWNTERSKCQANTTLLNNSTPPPQAQPLRPPESFFHKWRPRKPLRKNETSKIKPSAKAAGNNTKGSLPGKQPRQ